MITSITVFK